MATYLRVSDDIAERVASGALTAGDELPSVREAARRYGTTTTTVARAYRRLADAVVTVGERGSFHGLTGLWRGSADAAAIHLRHRSGAHNSPFARNLLRGRRPALIHLWRREQGLLTPGGNPSHVTGIAELRGLRVARRQFGTGTRALLDQLLADAGIPSAAVTGPEAASHLEVAMAIAAGQADAGLGVRAAATALDLDFSPVTWEEFDIVLSTDSLEAAGPLIAALRDPAVRHAVDALGGYDLFRTGTVRLLD